MDFVNIINYKDSNLNFSLRGIKLKIHMSPLLPDL